MKFLEAKNIRNATDVAVKGADNGVDLGEIMIQAELEGNMKHVLATADDVLVQTSDAILFAAAATSYGTDIVVSTVRTAFAAAVTRLVTKVLTGRGFNVEVCDQSVGYLLHIDWSNA